MIDVITGFHPEGYEQYGKRFMSTFEQYWCKKTFNLIPYVEKSIGFANERFVQDVQPLTDFLERHKDNRKVHGTEITQCWKNNDIGKGYCYKTDAYKFSRIPFYIEHALNNTTADYLLWIDGDTYTFNPINKHTIVKQLPKGKAVAYLGRVKTHTECGFLLFNVALGRRIIEGWSECYRHDTFLDMREWHNSYVFDVVLEAYSELGHNMTPAGSGHVWFQSEIGSYVDHIKGFKRKELGYSPERYGKRL